MTVSISRVYPAFLVTAGIRSAWMLDPPCFFGQHVFVLYADLRRR